jgi:5-methylcytosine-specific restriction endonuclease McrA
VLRLVPHPQLVISSGGKRILRDIDFYSELAVESEMITDQLGPDGLKDCFRAPIPEIFEAAHLLNCAAAAHLSGDPVAADQALRAADMSVIGEWLDSIWLGRNEPYRHVQKVADLPPVLPKSERFKPRDATPEMKRALVARDGHHCRLCGIPLVRPEVRKVLTQHYPKAARWTGIKATEQHRGLQVMWLQYDHVVVHSRGGETTMDNLVVTCPACNFGRDRFMMAEVGLRDPRLHPRSPCWELWRDWDGLERILPENDQYTLLSPNEKGS